MSRHPSAAHLHAQPGPQHRASLSLLRKVIIDFESPEALEKKSGRNPWELLARYPDAYVKLKPAYNIMYKKYPIEVLFTGPDPCRTARFGRFYRRDHGIAPGSPPDNDGLGTRHAAAGDNFDQPAARRSD